LRRICSHGTSDVPDPAAERRRKKGRSPAARAGRRGTCGRTHYWLGPRSGARLIVYTPADSDSRDLLEKPVASL